MNIFVCIVDNCLERKQLGVEKCLTYISILSLLNINRFIFWVMVRESRTEERVGFVSCVPVYTNIAGGLVHASVSYLILLWIYVLVHIFFFTSSLWSNLTFLCHVWCYDPANKGGSTKLGVCWIKGKGLFLKPAFLCFNSERLRFLCLYNWKLLFKDGQSGIREEWWPLSCLTSQIVCLIRLLLLSRFRLPRNKNNPPPLSLSFSLWEFFFPKVFQTPWRGVRKAGAAGGRTQPKHLVWRHGGRSQR